VAVLQACVGHAGASGYIAVLSLAGLASPQIRAVALVLNVVVADQGTIQFATAWRLLAPLTYPSAGPAWASWPG